MRIIFTVIMMAFVMNACSKDDPWDGKDYDPRIIGKWEYVGNDEDNNRYLIFNEDKSAIVYVWARKGSIVNESLKEGIFTMDKTHLYIKYEDGRRSGSMHNFDGETLTFGLDFKRAKED